MCLKCIPTNNLSDDYLNGLPPIFTQAMQDLYSGKIQPADLHGDLVRAIAAELWQGVGIGFNTDFNILDVDSQQYRLAKSFQENIYVFSGFKTYHELKEASLMMVDELGKQKPFTQFMQDVQKVNKTYNVTYLRNEYDNATVSGQMANKWMDFSEDGLLKFISTIDDHTTEICYNLNGLIKPKTWSGWKKYYLPLHWGERSNIIEVADGDISQVHESDLDEPKPMFNGNIAIDGVIFPDTHPYFNAPKKDIGKIVENSLKLIPKTTKKAVTQKSIEDLKNRGVNFTDNNKQNLSNKDAVEAFKTLAKGMEPTQLINEIEDIFSPYEVKWKDRKFVFNTTAKTNETLLTVTHRGYNDLGDITLVRDFIKTENGLSVYHNYFQIPDTMQGSGISKAVLNSFYTQYKSMKVSAIKVYANINVGGYTWAKYGFTGSSKSEVQRIINRAKSKLSDSEFLKAEKIFNNYYNTNPNGTEFPMNKLSNLTFGKKILLDTDWHGTINLTNRKQRHTFEKYLAKNPK